MKIEGKVATIIFKNSTNSWTVMLLKRDKGYITAVGETQDLEVGDELELEGEETTHKVYGEQFQFTTYKKLLPKTDAALIQYIAENIKGVGKKTAALIVDLFGEETVNTIRYTPSKLNDIKGLNETKIDDLNRFFNEEWEKWNVIEYLSSFNISVVTANKIYQTLGSDTVKIVKENPYSLIDFVKKLDFKTVDEIGKSLGVNLDSDQRVDTGIVYAINKVTEFGHTCVEEENLIKFASDILEVGTKEIKNGITRLILNSKLYMQTIDEKNYIFKRSFYLAEENIASNILLRAKDKPLGVDYTKQIENVSKRNAIELSKEQKEAISNSLNNKLTIITGGPGTGKTTIIKCIIDILEEMKKEYVLCAPTGRAAKRIKETTGKEAKTLHRLLEITKVDDNDVDMFYELPVTPIDTDVVIVDEASMIDCMLMNNLFKALNSSTQVIMVGDVNQLPSVGAGNVLKDIIHSNVINTVYLKHIYRQSAMSDIIVNAHRVNEGEYPEFKTKDTDLFYIKTDSIESTLAEISSLISYRIESFATLNVLKDLQVLTPMKKTQLGTIELNTLIQEVLNPKATTKKEKEFNGKIYREGDKVMQIINNYDKKFAINGDFFDGIYNGDIGYIKSIDNVNQKLIVLFDEEKEVVYEFDELDQLEHAFAVTIHKSQGSEFDYVILPLYTGYQKLFTRNLLYTAMTRAKKMLVIVGSTNIINYMVDNIESKNRITGLTAKIVAKKG
ncbi:MAG: ATP-dependent RecD-like DNA helicase [Clostridia bacterium]|nr:ATP-dependent RecD-like DNA helicase [Clostridia bacterium]